MSASQKAVRALLGTHSLALAALTLVAAPHPVPVLAVVLGALSAAAAARPGSWFVAVLLLGHALHWTMSVPVPTTVSAWVTLLVAAWLALVIHACAALAAALPPQAPVPRITVRRWVRRTAAVMGMVVPVWVLASVAGQQQVAGEVSLTYAAIAGVAVLALTVWLLSREPVRGG
jgi:hypothetical protein